jgi:hypothetical protein
MSAILLAIAKSAGLLLPVVILTIFASMASVRRAEALAHHGGAEAASDPAHDGEAETPTGPKLPFMPDRDPTVLEILILGAVLFSITMGLFLGYSVMSQM